MAFLALLALVWAADRAVQIDRQGAVCAKLGQQVQIDFALTFRRGLQIEATCVGHSPIRAT
ncbi:hypothetical protein [Methylobacterium fujisawaense]|uniref:hypothetical protein n=1 Tax=Methylobacterium fujisawaense TaxID=107400 RepID=UPI002F34F0ED